MSTLSKTEPNFWDKYEAMSGPVKILDEHGAYPSNLDAAIIEQDKYFNPQPEIDSLWVAQDGRRVRIMKIIEGNGKGQGWRAKVFVLPPRKQRQKRYTYAGVSSFRSGFYKLESL